MTSTGLCQDCRYFILNSADDDDFGECHKYAPRPQPIKILEEDLVTLWPRINKYEFCGEYRRKNYD